MGVQRHTLSRASNKDSRSADVRTLFVNKPSLVSKASYSRDIIGNNFLVHAKTRRRQEQSQKPVGYRESTELSSIGVSRPNDMTVAVKIPPVSDNKEPLRLGATWTSANYSPFSSVRVSRPNDMIVGVTNEPQHVLAAD
jgi:hypothetical protein